MDGYRLKVKSSWKPEGYIYKSDGNGNTILSKSGITYKLNRTKPEDVIEIQQISITVDNTFTPNEWRSYK